MRISRFDGASGCISVKHLHSFIVLLGSARYGGGEFCLRVLPLMPDLNDTDTPCGGRLACSGGLSP